MKTSNNVSLELMDLVRPILLAMLLGTDKTEMNRDNMVLPTLTRIKRKIIQYGMNTGC